MISVAICDDNNNILNEIENLLLTSPYKDIIHCTFFNSIERMLLYEQIENNYYDIYILDIQLKGMNGLEYAKKIRTVNKSSLIIFITNYPSYVFDVFEVSAFDFIQKPILSAHFNKIFNRAASLLLQTQTNFVYYNKKKSISLPFERILYIEKSGRKAIIHTKNENFECYLKIKEIWDRLDPILFASVYSSVIINITHVIEIESYFVILDSGDKLQIGRDYLNQLKTKYLKFIAD